MRRSLITILFLALFCWASPALAQLPPGAHQGKAYIPHWISQTTISGCCLQRNLDARIYLSNITDSVATVGVTLWDQDGVIVNADTYSGAIFVSFESLGTDPSAGWKNGSTGDGLSVAFELPPKATAVVTARLDEDGRVWGHGRVTWSSDGPETDSLVGTLVWGGLGLIGPSYTQVAIEDRTAYAVPIHGGLPF